MPRISIGDCQLYYERHGAGFPVMFASGLGGHANFWREQVPAFARLFDIIVHDMRGVGQSDALDMAYTVEGNAADMIALMDALGVERAHIIGHATGSAVAQVLAIEHPGASRQRGHLGGLGAAGSILAPGLRAAPRNPDPARSGRLCPGVDGDALSAVVGREEQ